MILVFLLYIFFTTFSVFLEVNIASNIFVFFNFLLHDYLLLTSIFYNGFNVFLKAKTQYNYKHYFKLGCYIYLLVS